MNLIIESSLISEGLTDESDKSFLLFADETDGDTRQPRISIVCAIAATSTGAYNHLKESNVYLNKQHIHFVEKRFPWFVWPDLLLFDCNELLVCNAPINSAVQKLVSMSLQP